MTSTSSNKNQWRSEGAVVRRSDEHATMPGPRSLHARTKNLFAKDPQTLDNSNSHKENTNYGEVDIEASAHSQSQKNSHHHATHQYRLECRAPTEASLFRRIITLNGWLRPLGNTTGPSEGINSNQSLAMHLHWMFRVNFCFLFLVMCTIFFVLVIFFAGFIALAGRMDAQCVRVGSLSFGESGAPFADAFALSWTTMATVGYGVTYPALTHQNSNRTNCFFINFICSLEALIGVLYSGFCGAVLFGKVLRIQSHAQVIFSDPILIRYGKGILSTSTCTTASAVEENGDQQSLPCPILEFRIVNRLFNEIGGEIMDASLNVVANINANDIDPKSKDSVDGNSSGRGSLRNGFALSSVRSQATGSILTGDTGSDNGMGQESKVTRFLGHIGHSLHGNMIDEDPTARIVNKIVFSKMAIEASEHPFFRRVWVVRHVLNEHSPILKDKLRRQIRRHNGRWPEKFNNPDSIRGCLKFNQILVSLTGVSNVSAAAVYAQKIYDFVDVNIGYQFVNILYRNGDGSLGVDIDLINDVREQNGGGGESLIDD